MAVTNQKYEIGKCYMLLQGHYYFLPALQESVSFKDPVAIKLTHFFNGQPAFGKLIRICKGAFFADDITDFEVEITGPLGEEIKEDTKGFDLLSMYKEFI